MENQTNKQFGALGKTKAFPEKLEVTVNKITEDKEIFVSAVNGRSAICKMYTNNAFVKSREEATAYAELFASAPDMLKVLTDICDAVENGILNVSTDSLYYKYAKEAIKKFDTKK
ncbi:MAG: hypothetical protein AABY22_06610 [Nanoarchaeota archaeon]